LSSPAQAVASVRQLCGILRRQARSSGSAHGGLSGCRDLRKNWASAPDAAVQTDVTDRAQVKALVDRAVTRHGRLDVIINNAGLMPHSLLEHAKVEDWGRMIDVNLKGVLYGDRPLLAGNAGDGPVPECRRRSYRADDLWLPDRFQPRPLTPERKCIGAPSSHATMQTRMSGLNFWLSKVASPLSHYPPVTSLSSPVDKSKTNPRITTLEGIHGCDLSFSTCLCVARFTSE
jgi:short chain dehydrogenase